MASTEEQEPAPQGAEGWFVRGVQLQGRGDYDGAIAAYGEGAAANDDLESAANCCVNLGWLLVERREIDEALKVTWRGVSLCPSKTANLAIHAATLRFAGKSEDAIRFYMAAVAEDPTMSHLLPEAALMQVTLGRYAEAMELVRSAIDQFSPISLEYKTLLEVSDICLTAIAHPAAPITGGYACPSKAEAAAQWQALFDTSPAFRRFAPVVCVGDSHAAFFNGLHTFQYRWPEPSPQWLPHVSGHYVASALAYSLNKANTTERGQENLRAFLRSKDLARGSSIMLSFGEIDLRNHVISQSRAQQRPVDDIVADCVRAYRHAVELTLAEGHRVLIWGPPASRADDAPYAGMFPTSGTEQERNAATRSFIEQMRAAMAPLNVPVISIFDEMVDENLRSDGRYVMDSCHLSMAATPLAIAAMRRGLPTD